MLTPANEPLVRIDTTNEVYENLVAMEPKYACWFLWPFRWTVVTAASGSKTYMLEFRPFMKFAVQFALFWKR